MKSTFIRKYCTAPLLTNVHFIVIAQIINIIGIKMYHKILIIKLTLTHHLIIENNDLIMLMLK